jgi:hypothetical protein
MQNKHKPFMPGVEFEPFHVLDRGHCYRLIITLPGNDFCTSNKRFKLNYNIYLNYRGLHPVARIYIFLLYILRSRDCSVGIASGNWLNNRRIGVRSPGPFRPRKFSSPRRRRLGFTQPPIQMIPRALSSA